MSETILYTAPGTCGRVTAIALNEAGIPFRPELVRFMRGEHKSPAHLARNALGKVPALAIDGAMLTENVAILSYLNVRNPEAHLMPEAPDLVSKTKQTADLCFASSTLHPIVTRIRMPTLFAEGEPAIASVYERGSADMKTYLSVVERRLEAAPWWYGDTWSVVDSYLFWVWFRITGAGFDPSPFPRFAEHAERMQARPAVKAALAIEAQQEDQLRSEGLNLVLPTIARRA